jgi:death-on-curing protein
MAAYYEDADLARQAPLLIVGIAQAHPFVDGNKRAALAAGDVMIQLNGYMVHSERDEFARQIIDAITRDDKDDGVLNDFTDWLRSRLKPLTLKP